MRPVTLCFCCILFSVSLFAQSNIVSLSLFFDKGSYELSEKNQEKISNFFSFIRDSSYNTMLIKGFTDADGSDESNMLLSENRVNTVKSFTNSIGYNNFNIIFYGEKEASGMNTEQSKSIDRRVDIICTNMYSFGNKKKAPQIYTFKPNRDIIFTAAEGTQIKIPANSLVYANGTLPSGEITLSITEYYSMPDIIQNKLSTTSNGAMLISAGMINITASRNDNSLKIKPGKTMEVGFADRTEGDGFGMFYGNQNSASGTMNWVPAVDASILNGDWDFESVQLFETDTISVEKGKFGVNDYGQKIRIKQTYLKNKNIYVYDTAIIDKTIYANKILLQSTKLGWLNCDQFYENKIITDLFVNINPKLQSEIVLVFKDLKSMLAPVKVNSKQVKFENIPDGAAVYLTCVATDGEKLYFTKQELVTGPRTIDLVFSETTIRDIESSLADLH